MDVASLGYRTDLALLQAGGTIVDDRGDHLVVRTPANPTFWWGNFVLVQAPREGWDPDRWLGVFAEQFPDARHITLGFDVTHGEPGDLVAFAEHGLSVEAQTVMTATAVREPARPNRDATVRALTSDDDWAQSVDLRVACHEQEYEPAGYREFTTIKTATNRALVERGGAAWFGAFLEGRLVSQMGLVRVGADLARYQAVETHPQVRGRGLAGTLVHHTARHGFDVLGARTLVMVADPTYLAIRIYRSVGFEDTQRQLQAERPPR